MAAYFLFVFLWVLRFLIVGNFLSSSCFLSNIDFTVSNNFIRINAIEFISISYLCRLLIKSFHSVGGLSLNKN